MALCSSPSVGTPPSSDAGVCQNTLCQISNRPDSSRLMLDRWGVSPELSGSNRQPAQMLNAVSAG